MNKAVASIHDIAVDMLKCCRKSRNHVGPTGGKTSRLVSNEFNCCFSLRLPSGNACGGLSSVNRNLFLFDARTNNKELNHRFACLLLLSQGSRRWHVIFIFAHQYDVAR